MTILVTLWLVATPAPAASSAPTPPPATPVTAAAGSHSASAPPAERPPHASSTHDAMAPELAAPAALFQRPEPNLKDGARHLADGDVDEAIESFRKAKAVSPDERAVVEYDVASALLLRALRAAQGAAQSAGTTTAPQPGGTMPNPGSPDAAPTGPDPTALDDARAAFERASGLAHDGRLKSEASLAAGNVAAQKGDIDEAIAAYRKALVADPQNMRARTNLRRALDAKRAQPPPPPQQGGEQDEQKDKNDDKDQKNEKQENPHEGEQKGNQPQQKDEGKKDPKDGDKQDEQQSEQDKQRQQQEQEQEQEKQEKRQGDEQKSPEGSRDEPETGEQKEQKAKKQKREEARRLLDAMRARERPLTPLEMRGQKQKPQPRGGKDW